MRRPVLRSAIRLLSACIHSAFITVRTVVPLGVVGEPKAEKSCVPRKSLAVSARRSAVEFGPYPPGKSFPDRVTQWLAEQPVTITAGGCIKTRMKFFMDHPVSDEQPCRRAKWRSTHGAAPLQSATSPGQTKQPVPSRERRYPFARIRITERPVHPSFRKGLFKFTLDRSGFSPAAGFRKIRCRRRQESIGNVPL